MAGCGDSPPHEPDIVHAKPQASVAPEAIVASLAAAEEYFQTRDLAKAEAILLRLLERAPSEPHALELHGQLLMAKAADARERGDHAAAGRHFGEAYARYAALVVLQPNSAGLQQSAGEVAQVAGRSDEALAHYENARRLDPSDSKPHFFAAQIFIERGDHEQAIDALERVLAVDPDEPLVHASLANIAAQQQRFEDALLHIAEARDIRPGEISFRVIEASIHRRRGEPELALEQLAALSPAQRGRWFVSEELAATYEALHDPAGVADVWTTFYRQHTRDPRAYLAAVRAGSAMLRLGQREEARLWLEEARLLAPDAEETIAFARSFQVELRQGE